MWVLAVVIVAALVGLRWAVRRRPSVGLWWTETVAARRAWAAHAVGASPTFGALQRAVLAEALRHRTVSVTGAVWMPAALEVDLAEVDHAAIAHAPGPFLSDLAEVLTSLAGTHQWRLDRAVTLRFAAEATARPGLPRVSVRSLSGESPAPVAALPPTTRFTEAVPLETLRDPSAGPAPSLLLDPEDDGGVPIVLGGADATAVIGRTSPADVVVADPTVSARHCRIVRNGTGWCIEDLGSSNGTILNGERIEGRRELVTGDVVGLGRRARYRVHS